MKLIKLKDKLKKEKIKMIRIRFCPRCNCRDIVVIAGGVIGMFKCVDCGFQSPVFPEREFKIKENKIMEV